MNHIYDHWKLKAFGFTTLIMLSAVAALAQPGGIHGTISTSDGAAAEYVNVSIKGTDKGTTTDATGKFEIRKVSPGTHILLASFVGFTPIEKSVEVESGKINTVDFVLNETSAQLSEVEVRGERDGYKLDAPSNSLRLQSTLLETPQNIQIVTKDILKDQQVISMSDGLIRNVSGAVRM